MVRSDEKFELIALVVLIAIAFGIDACWNEYVHHDWTCMWSKCVRVKP